MKRLRNMTHDGGFTLLEVLAVMVIVGLLASITAPQISQWRNRGYTTAMKTDSRHVATAIESSFIDKGAYPTAAEVNALVAADSALNADATLTSYSTSGSQFTFKIVSPKLPANADTLTFVSNGSTPFVIGAN